MRQFVTKKEYVVKWLREEVVSGRIPAGTRVFPQEIATKLGVSVTPVREAMLQLESEGYLVGRPHLGMEVASVNLDDVEEIYLLRSILEGYLARRCAARADTAVVAELRKLQAQFEEATELGDDEAARATNYWLHGLIWDTADQPIMREIVVNLWPRFPWEALEGVLPVRGRKSVGEHDALIAAIADHKPAAAERAMRNHIESGRAAAELGIRNHVETGRGDLVPLRLGRNPGSPRRRRA